MSIRQLLAGLQPFNLPLEVTRSVTEMVEWPWSQKRYKERAENRSHEAAETVSRQVSILAWSTRAHGEAENSQKRQEAERNGEVKSGNGKLTGCPFGQKQALSWLSTALKKRNIQTPWHDPQALQNPAHTLLLPLTSCLLLQHSRCLHHPRSHTPTAFIFACPSPRTVSAWLYLYMN